MSEVSDIDYSTWLTKDQAAQAIGVTPKSIERFADAGTIQSTRWQPGGRGPMRVVYHPDDVAKLAQERKPGPLPPFLVPGSKRLPANGTGHSSTALERRPPAEDDLLRTGDDLLHALTLLMGKVMSQTSQTSERIGGDRLYLTLPEAAAWTGLTEAYLRRKCRDGSLKAVKDQAWKIKRTDLETL